MGFLKAFKDFKTELKKRGNQDIIFLTILLLCCQENVDTNAVATQLATRKADADFAKDLVKRASALKNPLQKIVDDATVLSKEVESTDFACKVLVNDSVQPVFGPEFYRLLQGMKDKTVENDDDSDSDS